MAIKVKKAPDLFEQIAAYRHDPLGFTLFAFDWGQGELRDETGPEDWQRDILIELGETLRVQSTEGGAIRMGISSGHGIGKTCLIAFLIIYFMSTHPDIQLIVTANTDTQLKTKTWRELAKWHRRAINKDWFKWSATKFASVTDPEDWFASAIPWSDTNPEAMAGAHDKRVVYLFDEASAIPQVIWDTAEGALTDGGGVFFSFGNPTRPSGPFYDIFNGRPAILWSTRKVDSRTVKRTDKKLFEDWAQIHGDDSDFFRIRVRGEFPRQGSMQFISLEAVQTAQARELDEAAYEHAPRVLSVDIARFGDDQTVWTRRQGPKMWRQERVQGWDTVRVASRTAQIIDDWGPHAVFIDGVGLGAGVVDQLHHTGYDVIEVIGSKKPVDEKRYLNLRGECWGGLRDWLEKADIPNDNELEKDLVTLEYSFNAKMQYVLEKKEDLRGRGEKSPDNGDSVAGGFASPVVISDFYEDEEEEDEWEGRNQVTGY